MSVAWTHFLHEGDVGVRGYGAGLAAAFANAARTMTAVLVPLDDIECDQAVEIACAAPDLEVTFTALRVAQEPGGRWLAQCVVDV